MPLAGACRKTAFPPTATRPRTSSFLIWGVVASLLCQAPHAQAESPPAAHGSQQTGAPQGDNEASAEVVVSDAARKHFRAGVNLLQDPDGARYEEAFDQFTLAYAESPSWKILSNLGITAMKLERDGDAMRAFRKYLSEGGDKIPEAERQQFARDLETLEASTSSLTLSSVPGGVTLTDERSSNRHGTIKNQYALPDSDTLTLRVRAGQHRLTAHLDGYRDQLWEVDAQALQSYKHTFRLEALVPVVAGPATPKPTNVTAKQEPPVKKTNALRIGAYSSLGMGVAGVVVGTIFSIDSKNAGSDADEICGGSRDNCQVDDDTQDPNYKEVNRLNDRAKKSETIATIGFIAGGAGIAAGVTLFLLSVDRGSEATAAFEHRRDYERHVLPSLGFNNVGLTGRF